MIYNVQCQMCFIFAYSIFMCKSSMLCDNVFFLYIICSCAMQMSNEHDFFLFQQFSFLNVCIYFNSMFSYYTMPNYMFIYYQHCILSLHMSQVFQWFAALCLLVK